MRGQSGHKSPPSKRVLTRVENCGHLGYDKRLGRSLLFALCSLRNGDGEDDAMVRDVAFNQRGSGSNPDVDADAIYGLRLLLVLSSGFSERFFLG